jgi:riboflavin synthase
MFSGIIEETGKVTGKKMIQEGIRFRIKCRKLAKGLKISDSVAINGVCHTITKKQKDVFEFVTMHETLKKTNLGELELNGEVNLENSLKLGEQIGGHFVFGHIDDTGVITSIKQIKADKNSKEESDNWEYIIKLHKKYFPNVIYVGSIAVDGVSLTVAEVHPIKGNYFTLKVAIIPYTYNHTTFKNYRVNEKVNIEFDFLGKYVQNAVGQGLRGMVK